jgi:PAS domain-containing protein
MLRWLPLIVIAAACGLLATTLAGLETPLSPKTPVLLIIGGIVAGLVLWFRDVSEEHRRREQFEKNYRLLMEHAISAVATHEMVLDTAGRPVDYVFLSANPAFEKHTGLRTADILGRRVTEVLPGIEETHLIETYGKVVLTDTPTSFEEFSEQLGRHYLVHAFPMGDRSVHRYQRSQTGPTGDRSPERPDYVPDRLHPRPDLFQESGRRLPGLQSPIQQIHRTLQG